MAQVTIHIKTHKSYVGGGVPSIIKTVRSNSAQNAYNFARKTQSSARRRVHVITGRLRDSIKAEKVGDAKYRVIVGMEYGVYEEYGTRYRPAHPYFRPAVEENKRLFLQDMKKVFHR